VGKVHRRFASEVFGQNVLDTRNQQQQSLWAIGYCGKGVVMASRLIASKLVPKSLRTGGLVRDSATIISHIFRDYGWLKSKKAGRSVDATGEPIPWFTYPAIDFIRQLDLRELSVFEYGSGFSTLFWSKRAKKVVSIENDEKWRREISSRAPKNTNIILATSEKSYAEAIESQGIFDIIVIDGTGESRLPCSQIAPKHLSPRGFVILDNSDLWLESATALRRADLIQVDFTGLAPINQHWHTTSLFFSRQYSINPLDGYQPHKSVAQPSDPWPGV
jgi:hypothetical protein